MATIYTRKGEAILLDDADVDEMSAYGWRIINGYAMRKRRAGEVGQPSYRVSMHRQLLGLTTNDKCHVDHINGNRADNRRENLRACTAEENIRNQGLRKTNKTGYKGACKYGKKYRAQIRYNKKVVYLGLYETAELAHEMYCLAADMLHSSFANHGDHRK